jgi:hypothetical protein
VDQRLPTPVPQEHGSPMPASQKNHSPTPAPVELTSPPSIEPDLDYDHNKNASLRFRWIDNVLGLAAVPGLTEHVLQEELHTVSVEEPTTLEDAMCDPSWCAAMVDELCSIEDNDTWGIVDLPTSHWLIGV